MRRSLSALLAGLALAASVPNVAFAANNVRCGIPPLPPIGCKVGPCVCDQDGNNCRYTFIC